MERAAENEDLKKSSKKLQQLLLQEKLDREDASEIEFKTPNTSHKAIQLVKASSLLSSIKSIQKRHINTAIDDDEEREIVLGIARDLKVELVRERRKNSKVKLCHLIEFVLMIVLIFTLVSVVLVFLLQSDEDNFDFYF